MVGAGPSRVELIEPAAAVKMLIQWQEAVPAHLKVWINQEPSPPPPPPVAEPRPLEHWAGKGMLTHQARLQAHEVQPLDAVRELIGIGIPCIQQVREWSALASQSDDAWMSRGDRFCWQAFGAQLFRKYPIDPESWWGNANDIPPASIGLDEFPWKSGQTEIVDALRQLRKLLEPALVVLYHWYPLESSDTPTSTESRAAFQSLVSTLPDFEAQISRLKAATSVLQTKIEELDDSAPKGKSLKQPSDKAITVYRLWFGSGEKQENIARKLEQEYGLPMDQGTVSRYLNQVKAWVEAGNLLPAVEQSTVKPIVRADSPTVELGANKTGRTSRQRGKKTDQD